ncbi:MAG: uroporphyrinogen decarboxylase family protein [Brevinematia bacterium]
MRYPALKSIFQEFHDKVRAFHFDSNTSHILEKLYDIGFQIFNFSHLMDIADIKNRVVNKICLMDNILPLEVLAIGQSGNSF